MDWIKANLFSEITAIIAVVGAVIAFLNYRNNRLEKTRRLKVKLSSGFLTYGPGLGTSHSELQVVIEVSNVGHLPVQIAAVHLAAGQFNLFIPPGAGETHLPAEVQPGKAFRFWTPASGVIAHLRDVGLRRTIKLRAVARDATDAHFRSNPLECDLD